MKKVLFSLVLLFGLMQPAFAEQSWSYGWEDGAGTELGFYGNAILENSTEQAYEGTHSLKIIEDPLAGTPYAYIWWITGLQDGDTIEASFYCYDITEGTSPSGRIWGHFTSDPEDITSYAGSAGGNETYSAGTGWSLLSYLWEFDSGAGTRDGFVVEARIYSAEGANVVYVDYAEINISSDTAIIYNAAGNTGGSIEDTIPPTLVMANATSPTTVNLIFSEKISQETAEVVGNYNIDKLTVLDASLQSDSITVELTTSEQTEGEIYTITVNNVEDLAGNPIEPNSIITFTGFAGDTTPPQINSVLPTSETTVQITFNEALDGTTTQDAANYSITPYLGVILAELQDNEYQVLLTTDEQIPGQSYILTIENIADTSGNVMPDTTINFTGYQAGEYDLIADIQADPESYEGQEVTICGVVTIGVNIIQTGKTNAYVQDNSGRGINIFDYNVIEELVRANLVEITGEVEEYVDSYGNATTEIKNPVVTVLDTSYAEPEPLKINLNQASDVSLEGTLLQVTGEIYEVYSAGDGTNLNIEDEQGSQITVRVWDTTDLDLSEYVVGYILQATGVGDVYSGKLQIVPGYQDQLTEGQMGGYENIEIEPKSPSTYEPATITFTSQDTCKSVVLFWNTINGNEFKSICMNFIDSTQYSYTAEIPGQPEGTIVYFYITASDTSDSVSYFPENAPKELYQYEYKVETLKAVLKVPHHTFCPTLGEKFEIQFNSRENDKIILRLYNSEGKLVTTFRNENSAGLNSFEWDGKDETMHTLPPGLYICHFEVIDRNTGKTKTEVVPIVIAVPLKD